MEPEQYGKLKLELDCKFSAHVQFELSRFDLAIPVAIKYMNIILGLHHLCGLMWRVLLYAESQRHVGCFVLYLWPICEDLESKVMQAMAKTDLSKMAQEDLEPIVTN